MLGVLVSNNGYMKTFERIYDRLSIPLHAHVKQQLTDKDKKRKKDSDIHKSDEFRRTTMLKKLSREAKVDLKDSVYNFGFDYIDLKKQVDLSHEIIHSSAMTPSTTSSSSSTTTNKKKRSSSTKSSSSSSSSTTTTKKKQGHTGKRKRNTATEPEEKKTTKKKQHKESNVLDNVVELEVGGDSVDVEDVVSDPDSHTDNESEPITFSSRGRKRVASSRYTQDSFKTFKKRK
jgi:hypothetical protein